MSEVLSHADHQSALRPEDLHDAHLTPEDKIALRRQVTRRFRGGVTPYLSGLIKESEAIRRQFVPDYLEGLEFGRAAAFEEGKDNHGIYGLERVYADRAVLTPYFDCAAYCRYCFKKTRTLAGNGRVMTEGDVDRALAFIASDPRLDTVLITGGDPLARPDMLEAILDGIARIEHVTKIRVGTRHVLFNPAQVTDALCVLLARYNGVTVTDRWRGRSLSVGVSINHPDELTAEVVAALQRIMRAGISIRGQIVLLKGINDDTETLGTLLNRFVMLSVVPYYLFHCMDVLGTYHLRTSVQKGADLVASLAARSGVYAPTYVYVSPIGKHRVGAGAKLDYRTIDGKRYVRAVSPYRADDFLAFSGREHLPSLHERGPDGFIVSHYLDGNDEPIA